MDWKRGSDAAQAREYDLAPGRANAPPEAVVPVSFNGPPDGSEDHHRGPQQAAHGPRRVSPPSSAAAGAVPSPAVVRQRFGARPLWSAFPARRGISPPPSARRRATTGAFAPRDARPRRTETSSPPRHPLPPAFGAPGRSANGAGPQVRCVAGPRDVRGVDCFGYAGTSVPATALASPSNAAHSRAQALAAATPPDSAGGPGRREFGSVVRRLEGARSAAGPVCGRGPRARGGGAADVAAVEGLAADRAGGPVRGAGGLDLRRQTRPTRRPRRASYMAIASAAYSSGKSNEKPVARSSLVNRNSVSQMGQPTGPRGPRMRTGTRCRARK